MLLSENEYKLPDHLLALREIAFLKKIAYEQARFIEEKYQFVFRESNAYTAEDEGLKKFEEMYKLQNDPTLTTEERRLRVLIKQLHYDYMDEKTFSRALNILSKGYVEYDLNYSSKTVNVKVLLPSLRMYGMIKQFVTDYIPLGWRNNTYILYNSYKEIGTVHKKTFNDFCTETWAELKAKVMGD